MRHEFGETSNSFAIFIVFVVVGALLYLGRDIFIPLALATLLSFALTPPMLWLRRYIGRVPAALLLVVVVFMALGGFGTILAGQFGNLARNIPTYQYNLETKLHGLAESAGKSGIVERVTSVWESLQNEAEKTTDAKTSASTSNAAKAPAPLPVIIHEPPPGPIQIVQGVIGPLLSPLATAAIVVLFMIFMLLNRELLRDRFIRLAGAGNLGRTTEALDEAARRVSRYLLMQMIVNLLYGVPIGIGLYLIGVPNAALWGALAVVMRFVPYVGPWIAAIFPLALSIAIAPGWTAFFETAALFVAVELITGNVIEPWLYGSSTGLSSIAVILAAVFWTWLWGFVGLILSVPLTVCLVVMGRHVPRLEFLSILLGDEPVLTPIERFYQRLLAADPDEATEQAEISLKKMPIGAFYDDIVVPALAMGELDRERGVLDPERLGVLAESASAVLENLEDQSFALSAAELVSDEGAAPKAAPSARTQVLCAPGSRVSDRVAASYLADLLRRHGFAAHVGRLDPSMTAQPEDRRAFDAVCVIYIDAKAMAQARYLIRRMRRGLAEAKIFAVLLSQTGREDRERIESLRADGIAGSLRDTVEAIRGMPAAASPVPEPASEPPPAEAPMPAVGT